MNFLFIGQYSEGTTAKMRADQLIKLLDPDTAQIIDTHRPFYQTNRILRSIGFRYKIGPLIKNINNYIKDQLKSDLKYDFIWIDKGLFIRPELVQELNKRSSTLVHYTPDMAFYENYSKRFVQCIPFYNFLITTKGVEVEIFKKYTEKVILTTQGFDKNIHRPMHTFEQKQNAVVFVGLNEKSREEVISALINESIHVKLVGKGWSKFVKRNEVNEYLEFLGDSIFSDEYARLISSCYFSLGLLSKRFPELHTTRTFEIPACKTVLITERNNETQQFFKEDEVLFYSSTEEMIANIKGMQKNKNDIEKMAQGGYDKVHAQGYNYESILKRILEEVL